MVDQELANVREDGRGGEDLFGEYCLFRNIAGICRQPGTRMVDNLPRFFLVVVMLNE